MNFYSKTLLFFTLLHLPLLAEQTILLWPKGTLKDASASADERVLPERTSGIIARRITDVTQPSLNFYPTDATGDRPIILICPGGGYNGLAIQHEGTEVASFLNSIGVHAAVLKYRVPKQKEAALQDAQRALRLLRHHAKTWSIDDKSIGILGFSAGGHLAAKASTLHQTQSYSSIDEVDQLSARPDFSVLIYPAYMLEDNNLALELKVDANTPPALLIHANDDKHSATGSMLYSIALKSFNIASEVHVFSKGGHGFGIRKNEHAVSMWPTLLEHWLKSMEHL